MNTIYYEESSRIDKYNPPPNYGSILYGIKNHCYLGNQEELKKENFTTHKYENEYAYKVFKANQEELKMLQKQLLIECGIGMKLDDEDESGFVLFGLHIEKALQLIIFHPFMWYHRRCEINVFPKFWTKLDKFWEEKKRKNWIDAIHTQLPVKQEFIQINIYHNRDEFNSVSDKFHDTMPEEEFEISQIFRYQNPILYLRYNEERRHVTNKMERFWEGEYEDFQKQKGYEAQQEMFHYPTFQHVKEIIQENQGFLPVCEINNYSKEDFKNQNQNSNSQIGLNVNIPNVPSK